MKTMNKEKDMRPKFFETANEKQYMSDEFNYIFNKNNGYTMLWGKTPDEDPEVAPFPVILDFEITERCEGIGNDGPCPFCCPAGTKILVEENGVQKEKPIEEIKVGDSVITFDNGIQVHNTVVELYQREFFENFVVIKTKCGKKLYLTWNHKVLTKHRGWVQAIDLFCADVLLGERNQDVFIESLGYGDGKCCFPREYKWNGYVYNFHCTPNETYIAEGIQVHNCYKSNTPNKGKVTTLEEAKAVIDKMPPMLTQIAFGTDAKLKSNPEWYEIFKYARSKGIIPNVTVADIDDETAKKLASVCGAVAVSRYHDKDICYNSVKRLTDAGLSQVNIHQLVAKEKLSQIYELIEDVQKDPRLAKLNAVVFLSLKRKGRGETFHSVSKEEFEGIVNKCLELGIRFGFDSCSANKVIEAVKGTDKEYLKTYCEPCESLRMSLYINAYGEAFPCSFCEGTKGWEKGVDVITCKDLIQDIWNHPKSCNFRELSLMCKGECLIYNV